MVCYFIAWERYRKQKSNVCIVHGLYILKVSVFPPIFTFKKGILQLYFYFSRSTIKEEECSSSVDYRTTVLLKHYLHLHFLSAYHHICLRLRCFISLNKYNTFPLNESFVDRNWIRDIRIVAVEGIWKIANIDFHVTR